MAQFNQSQSFPGTFPTGTEAEEGSFLSDWDFLFLLKQVPGGYYYLQPKALTYIPTLLL